MPNTATAKSLPFGEDTECPAGNVIQVKKTDDGVHTGTIDPAWSLGACCCSDVSQEFTITPTLIVPCMFLCGLTVIPELLIIPTLRYSLQVWLISVPLPFPAGVNHSIWVQFD